MLHFRFRALLLLAAILLLTPALVQAQGSSRTASPDITYTVSMPQPHTHLLEVEVRIKRGAGAQSPRQETLIMPVWTPGSYLIREFARHVQDFAATDGASGRTLPWTKVNKNSWRVTTNGAKDWRATYRVYANELTVRTNELNDRHAFWNNAALLMYPDGFLRAGSKLVINPPAGWKIATGLPPVAGQNNTFSAENFDVLYDSPVEVGNFKTLSFEVKGVPHRIVIEGEGNYDPERLRRDVQKVVETQVEMMGGEIPYRDYTFIVNLIGSGGGGLEHLNSTALIATRYGFRPDSNYLDFLSLVSHEFFHLWNVKRIRPDALGPFDYNNENYTKLLWVAEGITAYYEALLLRRAGLISDRQYLDILAGTIKDVQSKPGRLVMSAEEASFDAWIKYYRQDENAANSQISYYDKGALLGLLLDLQIRKMSGGARSLDDVMRYLYTEFFKKNRNYSPADFQRASEIAAGGSLEDFFARYVRGREELPYDAILANVGLRLEPPSGAERPYLGADLNQDNDRLIVRRLYSGAPAYEQGLNANDQIVALDGYRVNRDQFGQRIAEKRPGDTARLTVFRIDELRTFEIKLGGIKDASYRPIAVERPTEEQARLYQGWLGARLPRYGEIGL
ncbi:MAG TPA: PDZ domain-containing protein [Pyrinomonadaceae bacterium]|jgi:predicted metalloprotease with PDZ domain